MHVSLTPVSLPRKLTEEVVRSRDFTELSQKRKFIYDILISKSVITLLNRIWADYNKVNTALGTN